MYNIRLSALALCAALALLASSSAALAADAPATPKAAAPTAAPAGPSKEMREKMASMHEHLAACLRSDKSVEACHHEMMEAHEKLRGSDDRMGERDCEKMMKMHEHQEHATDGAHEHDHDATK
jgi:Skp family chaperone for outer membrane proteins